ncbi:MATE family efflux transporter [Clostridium gasigenes]|uniref:MATE family efflux transporter n=1 Tax=Clostridium gasigenes TaxID=94869 RepID=UPI0014384A44|nr:MATE family efflux transporter [Clostridium gasigenes]NKF08546.1 MATE family efflux transporter [Clostridium gasigenes]QSW19556.1 MATE family efflux transporter [Clostridium gasigenes]
MKDKKIGNLIIKNVLPSVGGMMMVSLYILFDTIIVGQGIGKEGLAALNIGLPIYNLIFGTGILLGTGSGAYMSMSRGRNNIEEGEKSVLHSLVIGVTIGIIYTIIGLLFLENIAMFLGANDNNIMLVKEYLGSIIIFIPSFLMVYNISILVKHENRAKLSMIAMGAGGITNVILDYIFVFPLGMGMKGAGIATGISSVVSLLILLTHFKNREIKVDFKKFRFDKIIFKAIVVIGVGSFIIEMSSGVAIFLFNRKLLETIGEIGVSSYSIISNISLMMVAIFTGICQGILPSISHDYGSGKHEDIKNIVKVGRILAVGIGLLFITVGYLFPDKISSIFTKDWSDILDVTKEGISLYFLAFPIMGLNLIQISYLQGTGRGKRATWLSLCRGLIFILIFINILPMILGVKGIWLSIVASEITVFCIFLLLIKDKKQLI